MDPLVLSIINSDPRVKLEIGETGSTDSHSRISGISCLCFEHILNKNLMI